MKHRPLTRTKTLVTLAFLASTLQAADGPFGLEMGAPKGDFELEQLDLPGVFVARNVPIPHSAFQQYILTFGPKSGLCLVRGVGHDIPTNSFGSQLRSAFTDLKGRLERLYGSHETVDVVLPGSIWDEPQDFMMGLLKKERFLAATWEQESGSTLKNNLASVLLAARATSHDEGYVGIEYVFNNHDACKEELMRLQDEAL